MPTEIMRDTQESIRIVTNLHPYGTGPAACYSCGRDFHKVINLGCRDNRDCPSYYICKNCLEIALNLIRQK